jgi:hypothetical protein
MAGGKSSWFRRVMLLIAVFLYAALLAADIAPNPFPGIWDWINRERPLAPDMAWQERLGSRPDSASVAGDAVAVHSGDRVELRDRGSGILRGPTDPAGWPAGWVAVAGEGAGATVITAGEESGYELRTPDGVLLHKVEDAVAVWTYRDARLDLRCDDGRACTLRAYHPAGAAPEWTTDLPGRRQGTLGANPPLASGRLPQATRIDAEVARPPRTPQLLGLPVERRSGNAVVVVETATGKVLQILERGDSEQIIVVGDRVIRSTTADQNGICVASASGYDAVSGSRVWGPEPYHVWSAEACEQRTPPVAVGAAMAVVGPTGRPIVLDAYDGRVLWRGKAKESVSGLSERIVVVRAADGTTLYGMVLGGGGGGGGGERAWERRAEPDAEVVVGSCGVGVSDRDPNRVYVWEPITGERRISVPTSAQVLACAPDGLVLAGGRSVGFVVFDDLAGGSSGGDREPLDSK